MKKNILTIALVFLFVFTIVGCGLKAEKVSLEDAKKSSQFTVLTPNYLPEGVQIADIRKIGKGDKSILTFNYKKNSEDAYIIMTENKKSGDVKQPPKSSKIKTNDIDGFIVNEKGVTLLTLNKKDTIVTITGEIDKVTAVKVAESMR